jgi:DNA polymerase-3 subunit epsilon/ATP-dependent DNA helicase DinG
VERALFELCRAAEGRTLALFTSHTALRLAHNALQGVLEREDILVLGQGVDGNPRQILAAFRNNPRAIILGTSSFWEGVDISGDALRVVVITRLPFAVPTHPVISARSELFPDPFNQYSLPQAILRFKQGFGRLIRSRQDRGVVVVLDQRLQSKPYGKAFLQSLPPCTIKAGFLREMGETVRGWLKYKLKGG